MWRPPASASPQGWDDRHVLQSLAGGTVFRIPHFAPCQPLGLPVLRPASSLFCFISRGLGPSPEPGMQEQQSLGLRAMLQAPCRETHLPAMGPKAWLPLKAPLHTHTGTYTCTRTHTVYTHSAHHTRPHLVALPTGRQAGSTHSSGPMAPATLRDLCFARPGHLLLLSLHCSSSRSPVASTHTETVIPEVHRQAQEPAGAPSLAWRTHKKACPGGRRIGQKNEVTQLLLILQSSILHELTSASFPLLCHQPPSQLGVPCCTSR